MIHTFSNRVKSFTGVLTSL